ASPASKPFAAPWAELARTRTTATAARLATDAMTIRASVDAWVGSSRDASAFVALGSIGHTVSQTQPANVTTVKSQPMIGASSLPPTARLTAAAMTPTTN